MITENTAKYGGGSALNARWIELIDETPVEKDDRDCVEIADDIFKRIRGERK